jgi:glutathione S-transferase
MNFHHEKLPSARERYVKEVERVIGVLNSVLEGKNWLVGDKCTYADLVFITLGLDCSLIFRRGKCRYCGEVPELPQVDGDNDGEASCKGCDGRKAAANKH